MKTKLLPLLALLLISSLSCSIEDNVNLFGEWNASIETDYRLIETIPSERIKIPVVIQNKGTGTWDSRDKHHPVFVSYHLFDTEGDTIQFDNERTSFPKKIVPNDSTRIQLIMNAPEQPGSYIAEIDLVKEGITWFKDKGSKSIRISLVVVKRPELWYQLAKRLDKHKAEFKWEVGGLSEVNALPPLIKETFKVNAGELRINSRSVYGFHAGGIYPQIWIRDSASIVSMARYLFDERYLMSWIIAHLHFQEADGSLYDFIRPDGTFDKNTAASDQEASLIHAAWVATQAVGNEWLHQKVKGKKVLSRLELSLDYLLKHKIGSETGLFMNAHTADWGDVSPEYPDQRAVDLHANSRYVAGIYTQAVVYRAMLELADLYREVGNVNRSGKWISKAEDIRRRTNAFLWNEKGGFYNIHRHLDFPEHEDFDETNIFATGGNTIAIISGLATREQSVRIITEAMRRQIRFNISTISGSLLPPYPKGFFKHPILDDTFEYQNGGQWDWFGGQLILGMYKLGMINATDELLKISRKVLLNRGFYEWDTPSGEGRGSENFSASAAALGQAVVEGLFGIEWDQSGAVVTPRLGRYEGYIYLPQPSTDEFISYHYKPLIQTKRTKRVLLKINSNIKSRIRLRIANPFANMIAREVRIEGLPVPFNRFKENFTQGIEVEFEKLNVMNLVEILYQPPGRAGLRLMGVQHKSKKHRVGVRPR